MVPTGLYFLREKLGKARAKYNGINVVSITAICLGLQLVLILPVNEF